MAERSDGRGSPDVTIAVVSWNTRELLARCLTSLEPEQGAGRASVWVVDNASTDGSADMVAQRFPWASLVRSDRNLGFGAAVNLVARDAPQTQWIAPCNADVALEPGALAALQAAGERDSTAGVIAPMLIGEDGRPQHSVYPFPTLGFTVLFNLGLQRLRPGWGDARCLEGYWDPSRARCVPWAVAAFLLVRRTAWDEIGGFDASQWMYAEDLDLGWRLARAGWKARYEPTAGVRHFGAASTQLAWGEERTAQWMNATYAWMVRRRGARLTRLIAAVNVAGAAARHAVFAALARLRPARWSMARDTYRAWARLHRVGVRLGPAAAAPAPAPDDSPVPADPL